MLSKKQHTTIRYDTLITLLCELVECHQQSAEPALASMDWQSADRRTLVLIYGHSMDLSSVMHQDPDALLFEYVLLFDNRHVFTHRQYRWPGLRTTGQEMQRRETCDIATECLHGLMSYLGVAHTTSCSERNYDLLERECAA